MRLPRAKRPLRVQRNRARAGIRARIWLDSRLRARGAALYYGCGREGRAEEEEGGLPEHVTVSVI